MKRALLLLPGGDEARGEVTYDPENARITIDALWHADRVSNFAAGDVFKIGARIWTNDAGGGSLWMEFEAMRNLCLNLIIIGSTTTPIARVIHRGDEELFEQRIAEGLRTVADIAEPFLKQWTDMRSLSLAELLPAAKRSESMSENVATAAQIVALNPSLAWPGEKPAIVEAITSAWKFEEGASFADFLNAMTRVHELKVPVSLLRAAESNAGRLLQHAPRMLDALVS